MCQAGGFEMRIVIVGSFGSQGDPQYRVHQPAAALATLPGVEVFEVHPDASARDAAALAADVLVLTMTLDVEALRLMRQRRLLGRPTVVDLNDYLPDVQPWNPAAATWQDPRGQALFQALLQTCDGCQFSSEGLAERLGHQTRRSVVFANHLSEIPPPRPLPPGEPSSTVTIGWGGSIGHRDDLRSIAPALLDWLPRHPQVRLALMAEPLLAEPFEGLPAEQWQLHRPGSLQNYLQWLQTLDIGVAPLLPSDYNACRSDVKFLEYAAAGVVPVLQNHGPYRPLAEQGVAPAFSSPEELVQILEQLVHDMDLRQHWSRKVYRFVSEERRLSGHVQDRAVFYRQMRAACVAPPGPLSPLLVQQAERPLESLAGWQRLASQHWRMDLTTPAELERKAAIAAMQRGDSDEAERGFRAALQSDDSDHHSLSFLALLLRQRGDQRQAQECFRQAHALDPLALRPRRGLEQPHRAALQRGQELTQQGEVEAAIEIYRSILRQHRSHSGALLQLAAMLRRQGRMALARACLNRLLQAHPDHARGHSHMAQVLNCMGDEVGAAAARKRAQLLDQSQS
jgi:tetratricopeptide (TPR) repeat protein